MTVQYGVRGVGVDRLEIRPNCADKASAKKPPVSVVELNFFPPFFSTKKITMAGSQGNILGMYKTIDSSNISILRQNFLNGKLMYELDLK